MRIGIDVRCLAEGRRTGVEEYAINLLHNIFSLDAKNEYILFFNSFKSPAINILDFDKYPNVALKKFNFPNKLLNFLFWYCNWPKIDKMIGGTDIFFMPNIVFGSVSNKCKLITTIHDLSFERYPETFSWKRRWWHLFINPKKMCRQSNKIIAVSQSSAQDIGSIFGIARDKIKIIHSGIAEKFRILDRNDSKLIAVKEKYKLPYKFILYLGTIEPRKNIGGIIRAYNQLRQEAINSKNDEILKYKLVIAGSSGWLSQKIFTEIEKSEFKENILTINFVEDADKEYVFNLASLFVYPSFFEGFGFPPLEAMACGVPVIISNNSSLPEVAGAGAIMIDPDKPDEICQAMLEILTNSELRDNLIQKGLTQSKQFNWKKTAEGFLKMINSKFIKKNS